jgi:hypothetical protein
LLEQLPQEQERDEVAFEDHDAAPIQIIRGARASR